MTVQNEYLLYLDIKRKVVNTVPAFGKGNSAKLRIKIYDDGKLYDLSSFTNAEIRHKLPNGVTYTNNVIKNDNNEIEYNYVGAELSETGKVEVVLTIYSGVTSVSTQPFTIFVYDVLDVNTISYVEVLQNLKNFDDIRESNEATRKANEITRQDTENTRIANENKRIEDMNNRLSISTYNPNTSYKKYNEVYYNGSTYRALKDLKNVTPIQGGDWQLVSSKGNDGTGSVKEHRQQFTSTSGQTTFTLSTTINIDTYPVMVSVGGVQQYSPLNFTKANKSIIFTEGLPLGLTVDVLVIYQN